MTRHFPALVVAEGNGAAAQLVDLRLEDLEPGDVTIDVQWSSLNYKDALAVTGRAPVIRRFPMVCGVDLAGTVVASERAELPAGSTVVATGCGLGEEHYGGFAGLARVPGEWCVAMPEGMDSRHAMVLGTAGVTAMLSFMALERLGSSASDIGDLPLVVTGASGGVGSLSVLIGSQLGYRVVASTGRSSDASFLKHLGAAEIIDRAELADAPPRPLARVRFGAAIDVVGGTTLANVLSSMRPSGAVAVSGLVGGAELATTVHPFILRGVTLAGINSVSVSLVVRRSVWERLANLVPREALDQLSEEITLPQVLDFASAMLAGELKGRVVVRTHG